MFLTLEYLEKNNACENGKKWFAKYFPNGAEVSEIMQHRSVRFAPEFLHWGYNHLAATQEEKELYWKAVKVDCAKRETIFQSDHITNSEYISRSTQVENSQYIFSSKKIVNSSAIISGNNVENSHEVYTGEFIYDSNKIVNSSNITNGCNVVMSSNIINSQSIRFAENVLNSKFIIGFVQGNIKSLENCYFINYAERLKNCMFCTDIQDKEYHIFNQPVTAQQFEIYKQQLFKILKEYECLLVEEWPDCNIPMNHPSVINKMDKFYSNLPQDFWDWVKTLPGYKEELLFKITLNKSEK